MQKKVGLNSGKMPLQNLLHIRPAILQGVFQITNKY